MDGTERERLVKEARQNWIDKAPFTVDLPDSQLRELETHWRRWLKACQLDDAYYTRKGSPLTVFVTGHLEEITRELAARDQADADHRARESLAVDRDALREAKESNRKARLANQVAVISLAVALLALAVSFYALAK